ncbi:MBL fold metallo-hydrolase, partial [bacterium]|nr:MBL fold metallo-hydrolase [bacterium]
IKFWGVRGSLAAAGPQTVKYGGNTPCVEISCGKTVIICDAGTGIRAMGASRPARSINEAHILLSHIHFDHVIGLPFFEPLYDKHNFFTIISPEYSGSDLRYHLGNLINPPYFPINILSVPADLSFKSMPARGLHIDKIKVQAFRCNHPDGSYAFKFHLPSGKTLVHISDNEPSPQLEKSLAPWLQDTDILIHDAQYTPEQYKIKIGWGHSPYTYPIRLAAKAGIKKLIMFHYDPGATDKDLDKLKTEARKFVRKEKLKLDIELAKEGMALSI